MKVAWAFNPFDHNRRIIGKSLALAKSLRAPKQVLEVVYVAAPSEAELATAFGVPAKQRFTKYPREIVEESLQAAGVKSFKTTILTRSTYSLSSAAKALAKHLARTRADLTLLPSHGRRGVSRVFLGSFAETLVHYAKSDLLVFNETSVISGKKPKILVFAHDFSEMGDHGLERALEYAKQWKAALHVIHIPEPAYGFRFKGQDERVEGYRERVRGKMQLVAEKLKTSKVKGSVEVAAKWASVADLIVRHARLHKADDIVVVAKAGRLANFVGGGVTRQILRVSSVPVLVLRSLSFAGEQPLRLSA